MKKVIPQKATVSQQTRVPNVNSKAEVMRQLDMANKIQENINDYNNEILGRKIDERFEKFVYVGDKLVVRLLREDFIKSIEVTKLMTDEGEIEIEHPIVSIQQVDARERTSDIERTLPNPLPFIFRGLVCAISKPTASWFKEQHGVDLKVGAIVNINEIVLKYERFYLDKLLEVGDYIRTVKETNLSGHEGYFLISKNDIQSVEI